MFKYLGCVLSIPEHLFLYPQNPPFFREITVILLQDRSKIRGIIPGHPPDLRILIIMNTDI